MSKTLSVKTYNQEREAKRWTAHWLHFFKKFKPVSEMKQNKRGQWVVTIKAKETK
jgi:hypothetical protein